MNYVTFPGLGLTDPIRLDPVAFKIFGINVMWYGVIITCGMLLAYLYSLTRAKIEKVKSEDMTDLTLFLVIFGVIGARLYYIIFKLEDFIVRTADGGFDLGGTLKAMVNLRNGGLAIYGGIIAGFVTALIVSRVKRIRFPVILDIIAPCLFIAQAIGRWGNFINVEAYGSVTDLPLRMGVGASGGAPFVHPTFLYESLWNVVGFILVAVFYKKKKFNGQVFLFYGIWYGLGRAWIEGLRTDSLYLGPVRISQILSVVIVVAFAVLMAVGMKKAPRVRLADKALETVAATEGDGEGESVESEESEADESGEEEDESAAQAPEAQEESEAANEEPQAAEECEESAQESEIEPAKEAAEEIESEVEPEGSAESEDETESEDTEDGKDN